MKISSPIKVLFNPGRSDAVDLLRQLRPGQILQAHVLDAPRTGIMRLQIGLTELLAKTQVSLPRGAHLVLHVDRMGSTPELRVLRALSPTSPEHHLLRKALPQQVSIGAALNDIDRILRTDGGALPGGLVAAVRLLLNGVSDLSSLDANRVAEQLLRSGLLFEANLARRGRATEGDMKLALMLLLRRLQTSRSSSQPGHRANDATPDGAVHPNQPAIESANRNLERLMQLLSAALARINIHQVVTLMQELPERPVWQFDLPVLANGEFEEVLLRIEAEEPRRETQHDGQDGMRWTAMLRFDFENTGWIQANITIQKNHIAGTFWCERKNTERRIEAQLPHLASAMNDAGLLVGALTARHGDPPRQPELPTPGHTLIDERA